MTIEQARRQLAELRTAKQAGQARLREAAQAIKRLSRTVDPRQPELLDAQREHAAARSALDRILRSERAARADLADGLNTLVGQPTRDEVATLDPGFPIVLFPVRLETRYSAATRELRIRVYPDAITADMFDAALSARERALGVTYWRLAWDPARERDAWAALLGSVKPTRAAWIVRATTPTNLSDRPAGEPLFPPTQERADTWSRAAETRLLPDRWIAIAERGGQEVGRVTGPPIREPLALTLAPDAEDDEVVALADGLEVDADFAWTFDLARAEEAGMALRMPLTDEDLARGFDRLIVLGVKSSLPPEETGLAMASLLDAQHYSRGLSLVPQGTPTNNTDAAPAGDPRSIDPAASFAIEREGALHGEGTDGTLLAAALGVPPDVMAHVAGAGRGEQRAAAAMARALWPATLGYYMEQMLAPAATSSLVEQTWRHFAAHVRGRGPLPAIRAGTTPYGVLPVSSIDRWQPGGADLTFDVKLVDLLRRARRVWLRQASNVPRVGASTDADADLLGLLGMDALPRETRVRQVLGPAHRVNLANLFQIDVANPPGDFPLLAELGLAGMDARVLQLAFGNLAFRFRHPLVSDQTLSEDEPLALNYIRWIRDASLRDLMTRRFGPADWPWPLLARMLRHGALTVYNRLAWEIEITHGMASASEAREPELIGIVAGTERRPTVAERMSRPIPPLTGSASLGEFLTGTSAPSSAQDYRAALTALEALPTAELERLLCETLAVCSYRLDAWITSVASKRLAEVRRERPLGSHVGAYGWVEDLRPRQIDAPTGGYIHAPSMAHAATAAVLRNAHLTRRNEAQRQVAIDLSSARVRMALQLLEGVRQGQPLGALLGYRFERTLHDRRLDVYIERFRRLYPLASDPTTAPVAPADALFARDVVDGLALRTAFAGGQVPFGDPQSGLPAPGTPDFTALESVLAILDGEVDAAADLLLAESIYHGVQGQPDGAAAALSAAAGSRIPEIDVAQSPRGGIPITHRVVMALGVPPDGVAPGWARTPTPRAAAEPRLDAWAGTVLGDPTAVRATIGPRVVTLADFGLRPIDALSLTSVEVEARIRWAARNLPDVDRLSVRLEADPAWDRSAVRTFPELLELAGRLSALVTGARPLEARDLLPAGGEASSGWDLVDASARFAAARAALTSAAAALDSELAAARADPSRDLTALRDALWRLSSFGIARAVPGEAGAVAADARTSALDRAADIPALVAQRLLDADGALDPVAALRAMFGPEFVVLPLLNPPSPAELSRSLAAEAALLGGDRWAPHRWLQRAGRVRPALRRLKMAELVAGSLGARPLDLGVAQLPHVNGARWAGLPFIDERRPVSGSVSIVIARAFEPSPDGSWAGLTLDEWVELIPSDVQHTGIAVHHDRPGVEAPQAILIAVPPVERWNLATLVQVLGETLDLARIRAVDTDLLGEVARVLPGVYLASNIADDTVSTRFGDALIADTITVES